MSDTPTSRPHIGYIVHGVPGGHPGSAEVRVVRRIARGQRLGYFTATLMDPVRYATGEDLNRYDTVLIQRDAVTGELLEGVIARARQRGARLVFEVDDDFITERARARLLAQEYDEARLDAIGRLIGEADVVIVSTESLANIVRPVARLVAVVPNQIDPDLWSGPLRPATSDPSSADGQKVVYFGSATHTADLALLEPVFDGLSDSAGRPIELEVVGVTGADAPWFHRLEIPADNHSYPRFMRWLAAHRDRWAIGLAPLVDEQFNESKSDLKFLEYSMLGLPTVASATGAYRATAEHGAVVVPAEVDAWRAAIVALVDDPSEAAQRAERAADYVRRERTMGDLADWRSIVFPPPPKRPSRVRTIAGLIRHPARISQRLRGGTSAPSVEPADDLSAIAHEEIDRTVEPTAIGYTRTSGALTDGVTRVVVDEALAPHADSWTSAANALLNGVTTRYAFVLDAAVVAPNGTEDTLRSVAIETGAPFVQPVVTDGAGLIVDAGSVFVSRGAPPVRLLAEHPIADLPSGSVLGVGTVAARTVLMDLEAVDGLEPGYSAEEGLARATAARSPVVALAARVVDAPHPVPPAARGAWRGHPTAELASPSLASALERTSFRALAVEGAAVPGLTDRITSNDLLGGTRRARPILVPRGTRLRWAVRSGAPSGPAGEVWGDTYFAEDLAAALRSRGMEVVVDTRDSVARAGSDYLDDVTVTLRGLHVVPPNPAAFNILWVISHPEMVSVDELEAYDLVFAAGPAWARRMAEHAAVPVLPLLQATSPRRFHPGGVDPTLAADVLFVGKTRNVFRPIVRDVLAAGGDLAVYGDGWEQFIDQALIRAQFLPNDSVSAAYRSARIVLNDHWDDMRREGFLANRLFDAVASGARVVSDDIDGLDIFGGAVRAYSDPTQLAALLHGDEGWPDRAAMADIVARIAREHSFEARADQLIRAVDEFRGRT